VTTIRDVPGMSDKPTRRNPFWSESFADPFLLKARGRYYAYATEPEEYPAVGAPIFPILGSEDLVNWYPCGQAMQALGEPYFRYWAPEVTEYNGEFLLYYAVHTEPFRAAIRVAVAERPDGPFHDASRDLTSSAVSWAIDPHVFRDEDGQWYLFYTTEYVETETGLVGTCNVVDRLLDPMTPAGAPTLVTPPRHAWQLFERRRAEKGGLDWYCVEGPSVLRHRNRYYEMFSGGCYYRDNYAVSYATSDTPIGTAGMRDHSWEDTAAYPSDLLIHGSAGTLVSPGHNSVVVGPNNVDLYIAYHAWPADRSRRLPCLDRLYWHGEALWTAAPTSAPRSAPALPRLRELFQGEHLDQNWSGQGGRWSQEDGPVVQIDERIGSAVLTQASQLGPAWLLEVNARYIAGDGAYGVDLQGPQNGGLAVMIDPRSARLEARLSSASAPRVVGVSLPAGFRADAWHQILIAYAGSTLTVRLDGTPLLHAGYDGLTGPFALRTERCSAAFTAVTLTDHFHDEFQDDEQSLESLGWQEPRSSRSGRHIHAGTLVQPDVEGEHVLVKGACLSSFEYGVTLRLLDSGAAGEPDFGLILQQSVGHSIAVLIARRGTAWQILVQRRGDDIELLSTVPLPTAFDPHHWHTILVVRRRQALTICLDGPEVLVTAIPAGSYTCGLLTAGAAVAFMRVWHTGIAS
jgi:GH43 family beta-xylosidase